MTRYDPRYLTFLRLFNHKADYYECHEVMEALWLEEGRDLFYQGLLQVAVGLYHFQNQNLGGANKLMTASLDKLSFYPDIWQGIDLHTLRKQIADYLEKLNGFDQQPFAFYPLYIEFRDPVLQAQLSENG